MAIKKGLTAMLKSCRLTYKNLGLGAKDWYQRGGGIPLTLALDSENFRNCESPESTKG